MVASASASLARNFLLTRTITIVKASTIVNDNGRAWAPKDEHPANKRRSRSEGEDLQQWQRDSRKAVFSVHLVLKVVVMIACWHHVSSWRRDYLKTSYGVSHTIKHPNESGAQFSQRPFHTRSKLTLITLQFSFMYGIFFKGPGAEMCFSRIFSNFKYETGVIE